MGQGRKPKAEANIHLRSSADETTPTDDPLDFHRRLSFRGLELRRVLLPSPPIEDGVTRLQSVELYEDGLILRWVALNYSLDLDREYECGLELPDPQIQLSDDVGTDYDSDG